MDLAGHESLAVWGPEVPKWFLDCISVILLNSRGLLPLEPAARAEMLKSLWWQAKVEFEGSL